MLRRSFKQQVITLSSATGLAQAITFLFSPILTHFYTPEDFGVFSAFISLTTILSLVWTMRYELSIPLQSSIRAAETLTIGVIGVSVICSLLLFLSLIFLPINRVVEEYEINSEFLLFLPLSALLVAISQIFERWATKKHNISLLAKSKIARSAATAGFSLALSWIGGLGLILGSFLGMLASTIILVRNDMNRIIAAQKRISLARIAALFKRYKQFPQYDLPSAMLYYFSSQGLVLLLLLLFDPKIAGYYALAERLIASPVSVFTNSYASIFYVRLTERFRENKKAINEEVKTNTVIFLTYSMLPFVIGIAFLKYPLEFIFGASWSELYYYILALSPAIYAALIAAPSSSVLRIIGRQDISFKLHLAHLIIKLSTLMICALILNLSAIQCLSLVSLASFLLITINIHMIFKLIGIYSYSVFLLMLFFILTITVIQHYHNII